MISAGGEKKRVLVGLPNTTEADCAIISVLTVCSNMNVARPLIGQKPAEIRATLGFPAVKANNWITDASGARQNGNYLNCYEVATRIMQTTESEARVKSKVGLAALRDWSKTDGRHHMVENPGSNLRFLCAPVKTYTLDNYASYRATETPQTIISHRGEVQVAGYVCSPLNAPHNVAVIPCGTCYILVDNQVISIIDPATTEGKAAMNNLEVALVAYEQHYHTHGFDLQKWLDVKNNSTDNRSFSENLAKHFTTTPENILKRWSCGFQLNTTNRSAVQALAKGDRATSPSNRLTGEKMPCMGLVGSSSSAGDSPLSLSSFQEKPHSSPLHLSVEQEKESAPRDDPPLCHPTVEVAYFNVNGIPDTKLAELLHIASAVKVVGVGELPNKGKRGNSSMQRCIEAMTERGFCFKCTHFTKGVKNVGLFVHKDVISPQHGENPWLGMSDELTAASEMCCVPLLGAKIMVGTRELQVAMSYAKDFARQSYRQNVPIPDGVTWPQMVRKVAGVYQRATDEWRPDLFLGDFNAPGAGWQPPTTLLTGETPSHAPVMQSVFFSRYEMLNLRAPPPQPTYLPSASTIDLALVWPEDRGFQYGFKVLSSPALRLHNDHLPILVTASTECLPPPKAVKYNGPRTPKISWKKVTATQRLAFRHYMNSRIHLLPNPSIPGAASDTRQLVTQCAKAIEGLIVKASRKCLPQGFRPRVRPPQPSWARLAATRSGKPKPTTTAPEPLPDGLDGDAEAFEDDTVEPPEVTGEQSATFAQYATRQRSQRTAADLFAGFRPKQSTPVCDMIKKVQVDVQGIATDTEQVFPATDRRKQADEFGRMYALKHKSQSHGNPLPPKVRRIVKGHHIVLKTLEVEAACKATKVKGATDPFEISPQHLRLLPPEALGYITQLFQLVLDCQRFPPHWKYSLLVPLLKEGKPANHFTSYRPVALTSLLCRCFERVLLQHLAPHLRKVLNKHQYGFTKGLSCETVLYHLTRDVQESALYRRRTTVNGKEVRVTPKTVGMAVDFSDAFCRVSRKRVVAEMRRLRLPDIFVALLADFLANRVLQVRLDGYLSRRHSVDLGAPQGSVWGPLSWSIFANPLACKIEQWYKEKCSSVLPDLGHKGNFGLAADDLTLWVTSVCPTKSRELIQSLLDEIGIWAAESEVLISTTKTEGMLFMRGAGGADESPTPHSSWFAELSQLKVYGKTIHVHNLAGHGGSMRILGLRLDSHLNFTAHVQYLVGELEQLYTKMSAYAHIYSAESLYSLYQALGMGKVLFGVAIWGSGRTVTAAKGELSRKTFASLANLHVRFARLICGAAPMANSKAVLLEAGLAPLSSIVEQHVATRLHFLRRLSGHGYPAIDRLFEPEPPRSNTYVKVVRNSRRCYPEATEKSAKFGTWNHPVMAKLRLPIAGLERQGAASLLPVDLEALSNFDEDRYPIFILDHPTASRNSPVSKKHITSREAIERAGKDAYDFAVFSDGSKLEREHTGAVATGCAALAFRTTEARDTTPIFTFPPYSQGALGCPTSMEGTAIYSCLETMSSGPPEPLALKHNRFLVVADGLSTLQMLAVGPMRQTTWMGVALWNFILRIPAQVVFVFTFSHCLVTHNELADVAAKEAAERPTPAFAPGVDPRDECAPYLLTLRTTTTTKLVAQSPPYRQAWIKKAMEDCGPPEGSGTNSFSISNQSNVRHLPPGNYLRRKDERLLGQLRTGLSTLLGGYRYGAIPEDSSADGNDDENTSSDDSSEEAVDSNSRCPACAATFTPGGGRTVNHVFSCTHPTAVSLREAHKVAGTQSLYLAPKKAVQYIRALLALRSTME
jgi:hypothetical protein